MKPILLHTILLLPGSWALPGLFWQVQWSKKGQIPT